APDVMLDWNVANQFAIYAKISGGEHLNTLRSLYDYCPFVGGIWQYQRSNVPVTADLGFNIGPFTGFSAKIFGGYAKANDWLMPQLSSLGYQSSGSHKIIIDQTNYGAYDLAGWHAGVGLSYDWRSIVKAEVTAETASNDIDKAYYLWRDRAKYVINASVEVRPISPLKIAVGYELRTDRHNYLSAISPIKLKSLSNLTLGASYEISDQLTVFARGENLLNRHYNLVTDIQAQGLKGLLGLSYKF
ncbi:MAG: TonB-dependent receptor, partial [Muribaculaceae bacterium]|nr:TonB-dependent receptor [Muribaculaceae bacterium]